MDKDTKNLLLVIGVAVAALWIFRPKKQKISTKSLSVPKMVVNEDKEFEDAVVAIKAMRAAINDGKTQSELEELNEHIIKDYNLKVYTDEKGLLIVRNRQKQAVAKEEE